MILSRNTQEYAAGGVEQGWEWVVRDKANIKCRKQEGDSGYSRGQKEVRRDGVRIRKSIVLSTTFHKKNNKNKNKKRTYTHKIYK